MRRKKTRAYINSLRNDPDSGLFMCGMFQARELLRNGERFQARHIVKLINHNINHAKPIPRSEVGRVLRYFRELCTG